MIVTIQKNIVLYKTTKYNIMQQNITKYNKLKQQYNITIYGCNVTK